MFYKESDYMFLGSNKEILEKLQALTEQQPRSEPILIAVAFWGEGAQSLINSNKRYKIICNLSVGGTNPKVIREISILPNVEIRHMPDLHAKVIVGKQKAIVGSSNISAAGLGLRETDGASWVEAASLTDSRDARQWFNSNWSSALQVNEDILLTAESLWNNRARQNASACEDKGEEENEITIPLVAESELFKASITGGNKIRMAARSIELIYFKTIEAETKRSVWVPAYAASLIWVTAGNRIATRIEGKPYFESTEDVLERAKYPKTIEKLMRFMRVLSSNPMRSDSIQYWAKQCLNSINITVP
jgi:hypothetical protein